MQRLIIPAWYQDRRCRGCVAEGICCSRKTPVEKAIVFRSRGIYPGQRAHAGVGECRAMKGFYLTLVVKLGEAFDFRSMLIDSAVAFRMSSNPFSFSMGSLTVGPAMLIPAITLPISSLIGAAIDRIPT